MRTEYAEWWRYGEGWVRYGTERDAIVFVPSDAELVPNSPKHGYVYAHDIAEAMRVDAETFSNSQQTPSWRRARRLWFVASGDRLAPPETAR